MTEEAVSPLLWVVVGLQFGVGALQCFLLWTMVSLSNSMQRAAGELLAGMHDCDCDGDEAAP